MSFSYAIAPILCWLVAGFVKFLVNSIKAKQLAFNLIGYGGLPSNHTAIVTGMAALIGFNEGVSNSAFGLAITLAFIVILDASSLRKQIGMHAEIINEITKSQELRERMGHSPTEIIAGVIVGVAVATFEHIIFN